MIKVKYIVLCVDDVIVEERTARSWTKSALLEMMNSHEDEQFDSWDKLIKSLNGWGDPPIFDKDNGVMSFSGAENSYVLVRMS